MTLKQLARDLRKNQTDAEKLLWRHLRNRQLNGNKFKRQYYIDKFIADFICLESKLIIEIDGSQHVQRADADIKRTKILESKGFKVIRFWNNEILTHINGVLKVISDTLITPHPNPLPSRGEGINYNRR